MSYDFGMYLEVNERRYAVETECSTLNITSNLSGIFRKAMRHPEGIHWIAGKAGAECVTTLRGAVEAIEAEPDSFTNLLPPNGWGSLEGALRTLEALLKCAMEYPDAKFTVY